MAIEYESLTFDEAKFISEQETGLNFNNDLRITDIASSDLFALDVVELIIARHIMPDTSEPPCTFATGQLKKVLTQAFHKNVAWNLPKTGSALLRPIDTVSVEDEEYSRTVTATYELKSV